MAQKKTGGLYGLTAHIASRSHNSQMLNSSEAIKALNNIGIAHQILDDLQDSISAEEMAVVFKSPEAIEKNIQQSCLKLLKYGFTMEDLIDWHEEIARKALKSLQKNMYDSVFGSEILELCQLIASGNKARKQVYLETT